MRVLGIDHLRDEGLAALKERLDGVERDLDGIGGRVVGIARGRGLAVARHVACDGALAAPRRAFERGRVGAGALVAGIDSGGGASRQPRRSGA